MTVYFWDCVTDAGISMVISHCSQLLVLNLYCLKAITGRCALCEDPETTLCFITEWCVILFSSFISDHKGPPLDSILCLYISAHIFITSSVILHCKSCCSEIHPIIIIHIFKNLGTDSFCFPQSTVYFYWPSSIKFPLENLFQNFYCFIIFCIFPFLCI